jgi:hypothetical protein
MADMRIFNFRGSHFDVGFAVGRTFRRRIRNALVENAALQKRFLPFHRTPEGKRKYQDLIRLHSLRFPDYLLELEAISKGAEAPFEELFLANLGEEYECYAPKCDDSGCSTCSLLTAETAIFGHNEDNLPIYEDQMYLLRTEIVGKPAFTALCYPGFLPGRSLGFNSEGICFCANSVRPAKVVTGLGRHFIARSLFEARSLQEALGLATIPGRASGFNYTIGCLKERRIVDLEVSPDDHRVTEIEGRYFHANHYISVSGLDQSVSASSQSRQKRGEALLEEGLVQNKASLLEVLRDRKTKDYPILRDGRPPDNSITLVTGLFDLDSGTLTIYPGAGRADEGFEPLLEISMNGKDE